MTVLSRWHVGQTVIARPSPWFGNQPVPLTVTRVVDADRVEVRTAHGATVTVSSHHIMTEDAHRRARATDPATSHAAAARATGTHQTKALAALVAAGDHGLNDFELAHRTGIKQTSIGKRRKELERQGFCRPSDRRRPSDTGADAIVHVVTPAGRRAHFGSEAA